MTLTAALNPIGAVCKVTHSATQNIVDQGGGSAGVAGYTGLNFDTEVDDAYGMHNPVTNNWRIVVPWDGLYEIVAGVSFAASAAGTDRRLRILLNATARDGTGGNEIAESSVMPAASRAARLITTAIQRLSQGDSIMAQCWQDTGGGLVIAQNSDSPLLSVTRIGS